MVNQSINEFYTRTLLNIYALPQDVLFPKENTLTFFNNLSNNVREFLVSEGFQVPTIISEDTKNQVNQRLLLAINSVVEDKRKIRTIKAAVQTMGGNCNSRLFIVNIGGTT